MRRVGIAVALVVVALASAGGAYAAYTAATTTNPTTITAGTLSLTDDDGGTRAFSLSGLKPSTPSESRCIRVTYSGTSSGTIRMYATATGALAPYLRLVVERGTQSSSSFPSCSGFTTSATVYDGTLSAFPSTWTAAATAPALTQGQSRVYRMTISLANQADAQGQNGAATFTWEAR